MRSRCRGLVAGGAVVVGARRGWEGVEAEEVVVVLRRMWLVVGVVALGEAPVERESEGAEEASGRWRVEGVVALARYWEAAKAELPGL